MDKMKLKGILRVVGYVICGIQFAVGVVMTAFAARLQVVPIQYMLLAAVFFVAVTVGFVFAQRFFVAGIVTKVLAIFLSAAMVFGSIYLNFTYRRLKEMTGINTKVDNIQVYVLADDSAESVMDTSGYVYGILGTLDRENTDTVLSEINGELGETLVTKEHNNALSLVQALYDKEVGAIILNSAYEGFVTETEGYQDFRSKVKSISYRDIVSEVENGMNEEDSLYNGDSVFTIYVSGIDTPGKPEVNQNSDVNILLTVNLDTRQILMISTPRDYYIPLSISNGQKDKLTHAGIYGIDVSADTLSMLYGVKIDNYVKVNFTGFENIIDALDGVNVYSEYDFNSENYSFHKGYNQLNGAQALEFARTRHAFMDGDRQRGKNQMAVIQAVINDMATSDMLKNYRQVLDEVSENIVTSMSYDEIAELVQFQLSDMRRWNIVKYSVNGFDSMDVTYSAGEQELYVMVPDEATIEQAKQYLKDIYDGKVVVVKEEETAE